MKKISLSFVFSLLLLINPAAQAEPAREVPASRAEVQLSYAPVVKKAAPAVVNIYTKKKVREQFISPFLSDPFFQHFFGGALPQGRTRERLEQALGSGVIVRPSGAIVTSNHVIDGADEITVVLSDRREFPAKLVASDKHSDLAVLHIEAKGETLPYLEIKDSDALEVGDLVLAIGNPFGVGQTVTSGIISALARTTLDINDMNYFIQTDAAINPGNSGGALVTMDGRLIGINTAIYSRDGGNMGIGFAVPANMVRVLLASVDQGGKKIVRPWTGIFGQSVTADLAKSLGLERPAGLLVHALHTASPAKKAGIKVGDVIVGLSNKPVDDPTSFTYRVATLPVGSQVNLSYFREGEVHQTSLDLIAPPEIPARGEKEIKGHSPLTGARIANLSPAVSQEYDLATQDETGVVIVNIEADSPARSLRLQKGDIIQQVNKKKIESTDEIMDALDEKGPRGWSLVLMRNGQRITLYVRE